ncbi:E3 ubiquitin-protein ligase TRIM45-like [Haliotis cracherodii]|uniref:E3 ubiquitin-protein ligase TRIM45-like n=1 Tax=Haliotis cracherodii TaxID=6455 RepID=UPI0039EB032D
MALSRYPNMVPINRDTTKCTKCATTYDAHVYPRLLTCLHGICRSCLVDLSILGQELKCPVCDDTTYIKDSRAALSLPEDYFTIKVILFLELKDSQGKIKCTECPKQNNAISRCIDCRMYMCDTCKLYHERFSKYFSDQHEVVAVADLLEKPHTIFNESKLCEYHWIKETLYCKTCEVPICSSCLKLTHARHIALDINDPHGKATAKVSDINAKLTKDQENIMSSQRDISGKVEIFNIKIANKVNDIEETFHSVLKTLDERKRFLLCKAQEAADEELQIIRSKKCVMGARLKSSKDALSKSESVLQVCAPADVLTMKDVIKSRMIQLENKTALVFIIKNLRLHGTGFDKTEKLVSKLCNVSDYLKSPARPKPRPTDYRTLMAV